MEKKKYDASFLCGLGLKKCPSCGEKFMDSALVVWDKCDKCGSKLEEYVLGEDEEDGMSDMQG